MLELVSYKSRRILNIVNQAMISESVSVQEIQTINQCSKTTVYDDIMYIMTAWSDLLDARFDTTFFTVKNRRTGDLIRIKKYLFDEEISINLALTLYFEKSISLNKLIHILNYSESYIRKHLLILKRYLNQFDVDIVYHSDSRTYSLETKNMYVLYYLIANFVHVTQKEQQILDTLSKEDRLQLSHYLDKHKLLVTNQVFRKINLLFAVSLMRKEYDKVDLETLFNDIDRLIAQFKIKYVTDKIVSTLSNKILEHYEVQSIEIQEQEKHHFITNFWIIAFQASLFPRKVNSTLNRDDIFYAKFMTYHKDFLEEFDQALQKFETLTGICLRNYSSEVLFAMFTTIPHPIKRKMFKIGVYSDIGFEHAESIKKMIEHHFPSQNIKLYNDKESDYDFIVTTSLFIRKGSQSKIPLIAVSDYPNEYDFVSIYKEIYRY